MLKRWFYTSLFGELGLGLNTTVYPGGEEWTLIAFSAVPQVGFGFELSPRWLLRFTGGVKVGFAIYIDSTGRSYSWTPGDLDSYTSEPFTYRGVVTSKSTQELGVQVGLHFLGSI